MSGSLEHERGDRCSLHPSTILACCILSALIACGEQPSGPRPPDLAGVVTGAAAAALQSDGTFKLGGLPAGFVTPSQARSLSAAYILDVGPFFAPAWEGEHRGAIDYAHLLPCGRTYAAVSPYEALPSSAGTALQQWFGGYLLTTFCGSGGEPEVSIGVPAIDTALRVGSDGVISGLNTANFTSAGVAPGVSFPLSPEAVVEAVAKQTNRRVTQVPQLVVPPRPYPPQLAKWRIELETPAAFQERGDTTRVALSEVYFGYGSTATWMGLQVGQRCAPTQVAVAIPGSSGDSAVVKLADGFDNCFIRIDTVGQRMAHPRK